LRDGGFGSGTTSKFDPGLGFSDFDKASPIGSTLRRMVPPVFAAADLRSCRRLVGTRRLAQIIHFKSLAKWLRLRSV